MLDLLSVSYVARECSCDTGQLEVESHGGYSVHTAEDGIIALDEAETLHPDVMVVDLGMPRVDGFHVARGVRQQPWGSRTNLIA